MTGQNLLIINLVLAAITLSLIIYSVIVLVTLRKLRKAFGTEHHPENLEQILEAVIGKVKQLEKNHVQTNQELEGTGILTNVSVQKVGLLRFNTFTEDGGKLSFALALLDNNNSGVVITSLHGREQNRMYAKPIVESVSEITLSEEERDAIILAVQNHKNKIRAENTN